MDSTNENIKEFLTARELATKLGMSTKFIEKQTARRRIPGATKIGRVWRYRVSDVERRLLTGNLLLDGQK